MDPIQQQTIDREKKNGYTEQQIKDCWNSSKTMYEFQQKLKKCTPSSQPPQTKPKIQQCTHQTDLIGTSLKPGGYVVQQRKREDKMPCGLMNLGNTCYFNSLFQTYFFNFNFVELIVKWKQPDNIQEFDKKRQLSIELVAEVQNLILKMIGSDEKFLETFKIMSKLFEVNGANIFEQHDVAELNDIFLTRLQEGLYPDLLKLEASNPQKQSDVESSILHKIFFGKFEISIGQESVIEQKQEDIFNFIPINVEAGNLEEGLKNYMSSIIESTYKNGQPRIKKLTITEAPEVLQFHIQRVTYSKAYGQAFKVNKEFRFEKEIDIGQYCKPSGPTIEEQQLEIQTQLDQINKQLKDYDIDTNTIVEHLKQSIIFLEQEVIKASKNENTLISKQQSETALLQLTGCIEELQEKKKEILDVKENLKRQLSSLSQQQPKQDRKCIYKLQSIIIHQGYPELGHYYDFIYDFQNKKWFQLNDMLVKEEQEDNVLELAYGRNQALMASAYLLVYVNQDQALKEEHSSRPRRSFRLSQEKETYLTDDYGQLLNQEQKQLLARYNSEFKNQTLNQGDQIPMPKVIDLYSQYFDTATQKQRDIQSFLQNKDLFVKPPLIQHFMFFAIQYYKQEDIQQWLLIDYALRELNPNKQAIFTSQFLGSDALNIISQQIRIRFGEYNEKIVRFHPIQLATYQNLKQQYLQSTRLCYYLLKLTETYLNETYQETFQFLQYLIHQTKLTDAANDFFSKITKHYSQLIPLGVLHTISSQNNRKKKGEDAQVIKLLITFILQQQGELQNYIQWAQNIYQIIKIISEKHPQKAQLEILLNQFNNQLADEESFQKLENLPSTALLQCSEIMKTYNPDKFIGNNADYVFEPLVNNLELISQQLKPKLLFTKMKDSKIVFTKAQLLDLFE